MHEIIPKKYKVYTDYKNSAMLPSIMDGLTPVQRRVLTTLHYSAKDKLTATVTLIGETISRFHPYGDMSFIDVPVWAVQNEFAIGDGAWGCTFGKEPGPAAAPRYTKIKAHPKIESSVFSYINDVKWIVRELNPEPEFLPTLLPFNLIQKQERIGIGSGFKAEHPIYLKKDLVKRLRFLLGYDKTEPIIHPVVNGCKILSPKKVLKELLITGIAKLDIQGIYEEDVKNNKIYIKGWNPRMGFDSIFNKINKYNKYNLLENNDIVCSEESNGKVGTKICFDVNRQRNVSDTYVKMRDAIINALTSSITYKMNSISKEGSVVVASVDDMLKTCYNYYCDTYKTHCANKINELNEVIKTIEIIEKISPHLSVVLADYNKNVKGENFDKMVVKLSKLSGIDIEDVKTVLTNNKIQKLLTVKEDKQVHYNKIKEYNKKINNYKDFILDEYEKFTNVN